MKACATFAFYGYILVLRLSLSGCGFACLSCSCVAGGIWRASPDPCQTHASLAASPSPSQRYPLIKEYTLNDKGILTMILRNIP